MHDAPEGTSNERVNRLNFDFKLNQKEVLV